MIEAVKQDKKGMLPSAVVYWLAQRLDISITQKSKLANQKHQRVFVNIPLHSLDSEASKCWRSVFRVATDVHSVSMNLHETPWRHREIILGTSYHRLAVLQVNQKGRNEQSAFKQNSVLKYFFKYPCKHCHMLYETGSQLALF